MYYYFEFNSHHPHICRWLLDALQIFCIYLLV